MRLAQVRELADAFNKAEAAVRVAPDDPAALLCIADVTRARGDYSAAERFYTAASVKSAQPAGPLLALGRLYGEQQKWDRAVATLERAAVADSNSDEICAALRFSVGCGGE